MSHYETPEQRQIRELRTKISAITSQANYQASQNNTLRRELDVVRRQQQAENARLLQQMQQQHTDGHIQMVQQILHSFYGNQMQLHILQLL